jgi:hypothetical protein
MSGPSPYFRPVYDDAGGIVAVELRCPDPGGYGHSGGWRVWQTTPAEFLGLMHAGLKLAAEVISRPSSPPLSNPAETASFTERCWISPGSWRRQTHPTNWPTSSART